jgi:predicted AlkP superfamily pyrophosphatase or phosphodiesterase
VSIKDRGAVTLAGHAGKAFWFAKSRGEFVTSTYYYAGYPAWVDAWNTRKPAGAFAGQQWTLLDPVERYAFGATDDRAYEMDFPGFGRTFPHAYGAADDKYFTTRLTLGPAGDALTLDFAKALIEHEGLGQDAVPDYLAISFSSTDYVGHLFGASSLEMEDNLRRLDRVLADLFAYVDSRIGLDHVLIVLSADHGQPEIPGYLHELGVRRARHFDPSVLEHAPGIVALKEKLGLGDALIKTYFPPYLYLDRAAIQDKGLDLATVERELATALMNVDGIAAAVSSSALQANTAPDTPLVRAARKNYYPGRSGDIYLVFDPEVFVNDFDGLKVPSVHGSPWRYDTYVPVMFAAAGLAPRRVYRPVTPYDIAPTLAALLGISPPSAATGQPLVEVIER